MAKKIKKINLLGVPGINGLGVTAGVEKFPKKLLLDIKTLQLDNSNIETQEESIYNETKNIFKKTFFIGGDHSISYPLIKGIFEKNKKFKLIIFDSHLDLMPPMQNPTHEEWLRKLIEERIIDKKDILFIGIRKSSYNSDSEEIKFAKENLIKIIYSEEIKIKEKEILSFAEDDFYLSLDIDVFDKKDVSATGYPEKNGPKKEILLKILKKLFSSPKFKFGDLVEINPTKEGFEKTMEVVKEILSFLE